MKLIKERLLNINLYWAHNLKRGIHTNYYKHPGCKCKLNSPKFKRTCSNKNQYKGRSHIAQSCHKLKTAGGKK